MTSAATTGPSLPTPAIDPAGVAVEDAFAAAINPLSRPNPYAHYALLRGRPVCRQSDGTWVVSGYDEIATLLHDPRISSDPRGTGALVEGTDDMPSMILQDPPDHDRLRAVLAHHFTPTMIRGLGERVSGIADDLIDRAGTPLDPSGSGRGYRVDVVDEIAYPLPVLIICKLLGVPQEDEARFNVWAAAVARTVDGVAGVTPDEIESVQRGMNEIHDYIRELAAARAANPTDDLISQLISGGPPHLRLTGDDLICMIRLVLVAGHETSVNLITNGMLTLLRHPDVLERFRREPDLVVPMVEELLRYEPSIQFRHRYALTDIDIDGQTIPAGATVMLMLAAGSRDPRHVDDPDTFVPDRTPNEHFGFGGGIHYCLGAPLARMEAHHVLQQLVRRLDNPRLVADPPAYRAGASLRGPNQLLVDVDAILPSAEADAPEQSSTRR